jgi:uncharacterized protein YcfJ
LKTRLTATIVLLFPTLGAGAADYTDTAQVISATPIIERVTEPRQECTPNAAPPQTQERSVVAPIVGGVAGAVLGSQVGRGSGKTAATAAGAIAGAVVGDRIGNSQTASAQPAQYCRTVESIRDVVKGYTVVYRYNDRNITTTMPYDPGRSIRIGISAIDGTREAVAPPPAPVAAPVSGPQPGYGYRY